MLPCRRAGRPAAHRRPRGRGKKLTAAVRARLERRAETAEFLADVASEDPEAEAFVADAEAEEVDVEEWLQWVWRCFWRLSPGRPRQIVTIPRPDGALVLKDQPLPLPWLAIDAYATRHGIAGDRFDDLVALVTRMDETFLTVWREQQSDA